MCLDFASWIIGFVDGEGCFCVSFSKRSNLKCGLEARPSFSISQKAASLESLQKINAFFECGGIRYCTSDGTYKYEVRDFSDLNRRIIPFFQRYEFQTMKKRDFLLFIEICSLISRSLHRNPQGLSQIVEKAYQMNGSGKRKYRKEELLKFLAELNV